MAQWLDSFTVRNSEFQDAEGNVIGGNTYEVELAGDGSRFDIESVRYVIPKELSDKPFDEFKRVPGYVSDFMPAWLPFDLSRGNQSLVRQAYFEALAERDDPDARADDRGDFDYHQRAA